jgi:hypothetical protein
VNCAHCNAENAIEVRERKPGAAGGMAQSFSSHYHLCAKCLILCRQVGAIDSWRKASKKPRRSERVTVYAKTYAWLKARPAL